MRKMKNLLSVLIVIFFQCTAYLSSEFTSTTSQQNDVIKYETIIRNNLLPGWKIKNCGILNVIAVLEVTTNDDIKVKDTEIGNRLLMIDISFRDKISKDSILAKRKTKELLHEKERQIINHLWGSTFIPASPFMQFNLDGKNDSLIIEYNSLAQELVINENNFQNHYTDEYSVYFDILDSTKTVFPNETIKMQYYKNAQIIINQFNAY